jgi:hypothetical protein
MQQLAIGIASGLPMPSASLKHELLLEDKS